MQDDIPRGILFIGPMPGCKEDVCRAIPVVEVLSTLGVVVPLSLPAFCQLRLITRSVREDLLDDVVGEVEKVDGKVLPASCTFEVLEQPIMGPALHFHVDLFEPLLRSGCVMVYVYHRLLPERCHGLISSKQSTCQSRGTGMQLCKFVGWQTIKGLMNFTSYLWVQFATRAMIA